MNLRPFTVARWGMYGAIAVAVLSVWLGQRAGASLDYVLLRGIFVFVLFTALGFGAEAVLTVDWQATAPAPPTPPPPAPESNPQEQA